MATTSSTTKAKPDNQNLTRNKSINRKPKPPSSVSSEDGSDQKPEKPLPNYLKPTISSRPDPVKLLKKNNNNNSLEDNQKLLRRRSFDRPSYSSTSSPRIQKSLNVSPSLPRDKPAVPREKPVTAQRSSSFHGSRGVPRGGTSAKSPLVAPKKSGLSSSSTSSKSKKEVCENVMAKKVSEKEIPLDIASLSSSAQDDEEDTLKVESGVKLADDDIEQPKEVQVEVVQANGSDKENESGEPTMVDSPVGEDCISGNKEDEKEEEEEEKLIKEDKTEEETKEQDDNGEVDEEVKKNNDEDEIPKKVDIDMKEVESIKETTEEEVKEEEKEKIKEEKKEKEKEKAKEEESGEVEKREVVKGKRESSSAYNDVIASKIQENPRKNKVLALAGAFQTVIDYETAASK